MGVLVLRASLLLLLGLQVREAVIVQLLVPFPVDELVFFEQLSLSLAVLLVQLFKLLLLGNLGVRFRYRCDSVTLAAELRRFLVKERAS